MKIYGDTASGNCQKVCLVADYLGLTYDWVPIDITKGRPERPSILQNFRRDRCRQSNLMMVVVSHSRMQSCAIWRAAHLSCQKMPGHRQKSTSGCFGSSTATSHILLSVAFKCSTRASGGRRAKLGVSNAVKRHSI